MDHNQFQISGVRHCTKNIVLAKIGINNLVAFVSRYRFHVVVNVLIWLERCKWYFVFVKEIKWFLQFLHKYLLGSSVTVDKVKIQDIIEEGSWGEQVWTIMVSEYMMAVDISNPNPLKWILWNNWKFHFLLQRDWNSIKFRECNSDYYLLHQVLLINNQP